MSASEGEKQLLRREGYIQCFKDANAALGGPREFLARAHGLGSLNTVLCVGGGIEKYAAEKYPLPRITAQRIEPDPHNQDLVWKAERGPGSRTLYWTRLSRREDWHRSDETIEGHGSPLTTPERVDLWHSLLHGPLTVEQEEPFLLGEVGGPTETHSTRCAKHAAWVKCLETKDVVCTCGADGLKTHCDGCDRPEICDIVKRGTAPCRMNAGVGPAAVDLLSGRKHSTPRENGGAGEAGGLLNLESPQ